MADPAEAESPGTDHDRRHDDSVAARIARAVTAVDGVTGLHSGVFGEVGTHLPGGRVSGVRLTGDGGEVHIAVRFGHDLRAVAGEVSRVASEIVGVGIDVTVEDVTTTTAPDVGSEGVHDVSSDTGGAHDGSTDQVATGMRNDE